MPASVSHPHPRRPVPRWLLLAWLALAGPAVGFEPASTAAGPEAVAEPDLHTQLLWSLDGDLRDGSDCENHGAIHHGDANWEPGRFGKALRLAGGKLVRTRHMTGSLTPFEQSWTVECWINPDPEQPDEAHLISSGFRDHYYFLRLDQGERLAAGFVGSKSVVVRSKPLRDRLFDGRWHHVAGVLDRSRGGEIRLYLDGERLPSDAAHQPEPIEPIRSSRSRVTVGEIKYLHAHLVDGYRGLIDEVRISRVVREPFVLPEARAAEQAQAPEVDAALKRLALTSDPPDRLTLTHTDTYIALPAAATPLSGLAATTLQEVLRRRADVDKGFEITDDPRAVLRDGGNLIALGDSPWTDRERLAELPRHGYVIRRVGRVLSIAGNSPEATLAGSTHFLRDQAGAKFYLPNELFTHIPQGPALTIDQLDTTVAPFARYAFMTGLFSRQERDWAYLNGGLRRLGGGSHQHTMYQRFPPERFADSMPEIYPIRDGERYIPPNPRVQSWQPCFTEPKLVDAAVEEAGRYFRRNPQYRQIAYGLMDSGGWCECEDCLPPEVLERWERRKSQLAAQHAEQRAARGADGAEDVDLSLAKLEREQRTEMRRLSRSLESRLRSRQFNAFLDKVARRIPDRMRQLDLDPQRFVTFIRYGLLQHPPAEPFPDNVMVTHVFRVDDFPVPSDPLASPRTRGQTANFASWRERREATYGPVRGDYPNRFFDQIDAWHSAAPRISHHDWAQGEGWLVPRIYTGKLAALYRFIDGSAGHLIYAHSEAYPNWGLDAARLWVTLQLQWDPTLDADELWDTFCEDMFGPAAAPMREYFDAAGELWFALNRSHERSLKFYRVQFPLVSAEQRALADRAESCLEQAEAAAPAESLAGRRVRYFSETFGLSRRLFDLASSPTPPEADTVAQVRTYAAELIERHPDALFLRRGGDDRALPKMLIKAIREAAATRYRPRPNQKETQP